MYHLKIRNHVNIIVYLIAAFLLIHACNKSREVDGIKNVLEASRDSLRSSRDKHGRETAKRLVLEGDYRTLKLFTKDKDSVIAELTKKINKKTYAAAIIHKSNQKADTLINLPNKPPLIIMEGGTNCNPKYTGKFSDAWRSYKFSVGKDTAILDYRSYDKIRINIDWTRKNIFSPKELELSVSNENPYSTIIDMNSVVVKDRKRNGWKYGLAIAAGFAAGYKLAK